MRSYRLKSRRTFLTQEVPPKISLIKLKHRSFYRPVFKKRRWFTWEEVKETNPIFTDFRWEPLQSEDTPGAYQAPGA